MRFRPKIIKLLIIGAFSAGLALSQGARAAQCGHKAEGFETWLESFKLDAASRGISRHTIDASLAGVSYDRSVISHDRGQKVFRQSFEQFSARLVNPGRLSRGRSQMQRHAGLLRQIEQRYGVPGAVLVAIWDSRRISGLTMAIFKRFGRWRPSLTTAGAPKSFARS